MSVLSKLYYGNPFAGLVQAEWTKEQWTKVRTMTTAVIESLPTAKPMTVYDCIAAVSRDIAQQGIAKSRSNQQQGYKFRGIDDVLNALSPLLAKYRLVILPRVMSRTVVERAAKSGGVLFSVVVEVEFDFVSAADGTLHTVKTYGEAMDSADKATNKAMSCAYKYAAFQAFCIPVEGALEDADAHTPDVADSEPVIQIRQAPTASPPVIPARVEPSPPSVQNGGGSGVPLPRGALLITHIDMHPTKNPNVTKALINFSDGRVRSTIKTQLTDLAEQCWHERTPVYVEDEQTRWGFDLVKLARAGASV